MLPSPVSGALLVGTFYISNIAYSLVNKQVLMALHCPLLLTTLNFGSCSVCCIAAWASGLQRLPRLSIHSGIRLAPVLLLHWAATFLANISMSEMNLQLAHSLKALEPTFTTLLVLLIHGSLPSARAVLGILLIGIGIGVASGTDASFTWYGFTAAVAACIVVSVRTVLNKKIMRGWQEDHLNYAAVLQCGAFAVSLPALFLVRAFGVEVGDFFDLLSLPYGHWIPFVGAIIYVFNMVSIVILYYASPVTHSVIRSMRRPFVILASIAVFDTPVPRLNAAGVLSALIGAWCCTV